VPRDVASGQEDTLAMLSHSASDRGDRLNNLASVPRLGVLIPQGTRRAKPFRAQDRRR